MKKYYVIILFFICTNSFAQVLDWSYSVGGSYEENCTDIEIDSLDNFYITGGFCNTVDFDLSESVFEISSTGNNRSNIFLAKYNSEQELIYAFGLYSWTWTSASNLEIDTAGNAYISGYYSGGIDFDPSEAEYNLTSPENMIFLAKYDSFGNFKWAKEISIGIVSKSFSDNSGNIYLSTVDSLIKIDSDGNRTWSISTLGSIGFPTFDGYSNFYFLTGTESGGNPNYFVYNHMFINKIDTTGTLCLTQEIISNSNGDFIGTVHYDKTGSLLISGSFWGEALFNNDLGEDLLITNDQMTTCSTPVSGGDYPCPVSHVFISKFDTNGNVIWTYDFKSNGPYPAFFETTSTGIVYVAGALYSDIDFDHTEDTAVLENDLCDFYIAKYDQSFNFLGATKFMGGSYNDNLNAFKIRNDSTAYICGNYYNTIELGLDGNSAQLHTNPPEDLFIAKYSSFTIKDLTNTNSKYPVINSNSEVEIFPNPTNGTIIIGHLVNKLQSITVYNIFGQLVTKIMDCNNTIDISYLNNGMYIIEIETSSEVFRERIIKY